MQGLSKWRCFHSKQRIHKDGCSRRKYLPSILFPVSAYESSCAHAPTSLILSDMKKSTISRWYIYIHISLTDYQTPPETERILWRVAAIFLHGSLVHCPRTKVSTMGILLDFLSSWYRQRRMGVRRAFECKRLPLLRNDLSGIAVPLRSVEFPIDVMSWNGFFKRTTMSVATQDVSARAHTHTHSSSHRMPLSF